MASRTAAKGTETGEAGPTEQPRTKQTERRESWIPYPPLSDAGEPAGNMDYTEFVRRCQEDADAVFNMVNDAYRSLESMDQTVTDLRKQVYDLENRVRRLEAKNQELKDEVIDRDTQADDLIEERGRLQRTVCTRRRPDGQHAVTRSIRCSYRTGHEEKRETSGSLSPNRRQRPRF